MILMYIYIYIHSPPTCQGVRNFCMVENNGFHFQALLPALVFAPSPSPIPNLANNMS